MITPTAEVFLTLDQLDAAVELLRSVIEGDPMYRIATYPGPDGQPQPIRQNDGALVIMRGTIEDDDSLAVMEVKRFTRAKRGEAWKTPDPEQEAFAAHVVKLLNEAANAA